MPSSTSHSDRSFPWLALRLLLTAWLGWLVASGYTVWVNPEVKHFLHTDAVKLQWAETLRNYYDHKVVVYGGSSCEFSIHGERMLSRFGLPCLNAGRGAGMGISVLTMAALRDCQPGDTLIAAIESGLLTEPLEITTLGIQFSVAAGQPDWITQPLSPAQSVPLAEAALALRPGGYHTFTLLGKIAQGRELYRYRAEDVRPSGWNQTAVRLPVSGPPRHRIVIPEDVSQFLRSLQLWCQDRQIRLAYSLPWGYTPTDQFQEFQADNIRFLLQMIDIMPVLRDPRLGAYAVQEHFSDSVWHLTEEGAAVRTDELAAQLIAWQTWTKDELERRLTELLPQIAAPG